MTVPFPSIKPAARSFRMGTFPTKVYRALSGATVKRSFGNKPTGYQLELRFRNVDDAAVSQIIDHYNITGGGFSHFTVPDSLFAGMSTELRGKIQSPANIRWEYAGAPSVESVFPGRSDVAVELIGELVF